MDLQTAHVLRQLNNRFYSEQAESFSSTRHAGWAGWEQCLNAVEASVCSDGAGQQDPSATTPVCVLDVACGNMRFAKYYEEFFPERAFRYVGLDSCEGLADLALQDGLEYCYVDALQGLLDGEPLCEKAEPADLVACFGFMHHVPGLENRKAMIRQLIECAKPQGHVIISLWQFLNSNEMADRARITTNLGITELSIDAKQLESDDFLLGWQNRPGAYRYCHHFPDGEVLELVQSVSDIATCITSFSADGRTGNLNRYVVLKRL